MDEEIPPHNVECFECLAKRYINAIIYYYNKKKKHDTEYIIRYCNTVNVFTIICINLKCLVEKVIFLLSQLFECCYIMISTKIKQQKIKSKNIKKKCFLQSQTY